MIISHKFHIARKQHRCHICNKVIEPKENYLDLYGMAFENDKPYHLKICKKHPMAMLK
jgi:hypothetical protein